MRYVKGQILFKRLVRSGFLMKGNYVSDYSNKENFQRIQSNIDDVNQKMRKGNIKVPKMPVWERVNQLMDRGSPFLCLSPLAGRGEVVSGGVLCGIARIEGHTCLITANDWMQKGGTIFPITLKKQLRAQEIARQNRLPCVYIVDSGGAFLPLQADIFPDRDHGGRIFRNQAVMSSEGNPQVAVVCGPSTAGGAYLPTMSEEVPIVKGLGALYLGGPPLVRAATGEDVTSEELGGAYVHCKISGCTDYFAEDESEAFTRVREIIGNIQHTPASKWSWDDNISEDIDQFCDLLPPLSGDYRNFPMFEVIQEIVDKKQLMQFKELYGPSLITGFAHLCDHLIGVIGNSGPLTDEACLKGAHFIELCSQRGIPLVFFQNTLPEDACNHLTSKAKMMSTIACSEVPKITVIMGWSFGSSSCAMCNRSMSPNFLFTWPHAQIGVGDISQSSDYNRLTKISAEDSTQRLLDDGLILPHQTKKVLQLCLNICMENVSQSNGLHSKVIRF